MFFPLNSCSLHLYTFLFVFLSLSALLSQQVLSECKSYRKFLPFIFSLFSFLSNMKILLSVLKPKKSHLQFQPGEAFPQRSWWNAGRRPRWRCWTVAAGVPCRSAARWSCPWCTDNPSLCGWTEAAAAAQEVVFLSWNPAETPISDTTTQIHIWAPDNLICFLFKVSVLNQFELEVFKSLPHGKMAKFFSSVSF